MQKEKMNKFDFKIERKNKIHLDSVFNKYLDRKLKKPFGVSSQYLFGLDWVDKPYLSCVA